MLPKSNLSKQSIKERLAKNPTVKTLVKELTAQEFERTKTKTLIKLLPQGVVKRTPKQYLTTKRKGGAALVDFRALQEQKGLILKEKARNFKEQKKDKNWKLLYNKETREKNYIINNLKTSQATFKLKAIAMLSNWVKFKPLKLER